MNTTLSETYFQNALQFMRNNDPEECIGCIDIAISLSKSKAFYIYQKIKMLYQLSLYEKCTSMIISNIKFLYTHCSLFTFSQILYYYVESSHCNETELTSVLLSNNIPRSLAHEYPFVLQKNSYPFKEKAIDAKSNTEFAICIEYCNLALKQQSDDQDILLLKAEVHTIMEQTSESIKAYKTLLELNPQNAFAVHQMGCLLKEQNNLVDAISYFEQAILLEPNDFQYLTDCALNYFNLKQYSKAITTYQYLIEHFSDSKESYLMLAQLYKIQKQSKLAKHYLKLASKLPNINQ